VKRQARSVEREAYSVQRVLNSHLRSTLHARRRIGLIAVAVLALALRAQTLIRDKSYIADGALLYALAVAGFLWIFRRSACERSEVIRPDSPSIPRRRWGWAGAGGVASLASALFFGGNCFRPLGVFLWLGGLVCFVAALDDGPSPARIWSRLRTKLAPGVFQISWLAVALLGITLVGAFYRFYRLSELPSDMSADIGHLWVDSERILHGDYLIFSTIHPGREIMMFYLIAAYVRLFGHSYFAHKAVAAFIGTATIPVVYLLGEELFDRRVGLLGALFFALARWHVTVSRIGWRLVLAPLFAAPMGIFLARARRCGRRRDWLLAGLCLGFGLHTYNAFRSLVPAVLVLFAAQWLQARGYPRLRLLRDMGLSLGTALLAFVPLGRFALENPERFWFRILTRISSREVPIGPSPLSVLLGNLWRTMLMFNYQGDGGFAANIPFAPQLDTVTGALLVLGTAYCLWRWRRGENLLLLMLGGALLFTGALSLAFPHEVPSAVRSSGVLPFLPLLPALALTLLGRAWEAVVPTSRGRVVVALGMAGLALWSAYLNFEAYFVVYPQWLPHQNYPLHRELAATIDRLSGDRAVYLKYLPYWIDGDVIRLQLRRAPAGWNNIVPSLDMTALEGEAAGRFAAILHPDDVETLEELSSHFPRGTWFAERMPHGGEAFRVFLAGSVAPLLDEGAQESGREG